MSCRVCSATGRRTVARASFALLMAALSALPLLANPIPGIYSVGFDVHPNSEEGCRLPDPITSCDQIRQHCPQVGDLALDVYAWSAWFPTVEFHHLDGSLNWPADWEFVAFENCLGGQTTLTPRSGGLDFTVVPPGTLTLDSDPVWVGRLWVWADSPGGLASASWIHIDDNLDRQSLGPHHFIQPSAEYGLAPPHRSPILRPFPCGRVPCGWGTPRSGPARVPSGLEEYL